MIDLGGIVQIAVDVKNAAQALTNPATADLTITLPDGSTVTPVVTVPPAETGKLRVDYVTTQAGHHSWRMVTTGPVTSYTDVFNVAPAISPAMFSLKDTKDHLNIPQANTTDDAELRRFIAGTTRAVENERGEVMVRRTVTEDVTVRGWTGLLVLARTPVISLTSAVQVGGSTTWTVGNLEHDAASGEVWVREGSGFTGRIRFIYEAGYVVIPEAFQLAGQIVLKHAWETQRGAMGVNLGGEGEGWNPGMGFLVPHRAKELLGTHMSGVA